METKAFDFSELYFKSVTHLKENRRDCTTQKGLEIHKEYSHLKGPNFNLLVLNLRKINEPFNDY